MKPRQGTPAMAIQANFGERTINELLLIFRNRQMNLEPGFQRKSVWSNMDRRRLVQSILSNYPVPCIFLYQRNHRGRIVYDVIDGKQRLETILMFTGTGRFRRDRFDVKLELGDGLQCVRGEILAVFMPPSVRISSRGPTGRCDRHWPRPSSPRRWIDPTSCRGP